MSEKKKSNPVAIGAFVLGALALVAVAVITLGGAKLFTPKQRVVAYFEGSVNGLAVGSPVNFRGVRVGQVDRIQLQFDAASLNARIPVYMTLLSNQVSLVGGGSARDIPFDSFIQKGLKAKLNIESIVTGQLGVDLDFRPDVPVVLVGSPDPRMPEIPAMKSDFDVLKDQLAQIPFRQLSDDVKSLVESIQVLTKGANGTLGAVGQELKNTAGSARRTLDTATETLRNMQGTLRSVEYTATVAGQTLNDTGPQIKRTLAVAEAAMHNAEATLAKADATLAQTAELTAPGAPLREELEQSLRDLSVSAESLRNFAGTVERQPNALLFGKEKP
jgi:paraquat-inducible protein B